MYSRSSFRLLFLSVTLLLMVCAMPAKAHRHHHRSSSASAFSSIHSSVSLMEDKVTALPHRRAHISDFVRNLVQSMSLKEKVRQLDMFQGYHFLDRNGIYSGTSLSSLYLSIYLYLYLSIYLFSLSLSLTSLRVLRKLRHGQSAALHRQRGCRMHPRLVSADSRDYQPVTAIHTREYHPEDSGAYMF